MSAAQPCPVLVAPVEEVEPLLRSAQADIAKLKLRLRHAVHEIEAAEADTRADRRSGAQELLRTHLDELVERRRQELERILEEVRGEAREVVEAAREEAAAMANEAHRTAEPEPEPEWQSPRRLRVVDLRDSAPVLVGAAVPQDDPLPEMNLVHEPVERTASPEAERPNELTPERLAPIVEAAVAAALAGVAATTGLLNLLPPGGPVPLVDVPVVDRRPLWRRFFYADVLLPLIAVFAVVVIVFAWVG